TSFLSRVYDVKSSVFVQSPFRFFRTLAPLSVHREAHPLRIPCRSSVTSGIGHPFVTRHTFWNRIPGRRRPAWPRTHLPSTPLRYRCDADAPPPSSRSTTRAKPARVLVPGKRIVEPRNRRSGGRAPARAGVLRFAVDMLLDIPDSTHGRSRRRYVPAYGLSLTMTLSWASLDLQCRPPRTRRRTSAEANVSPPSSSKGRRRRRSKGEERTGVGAQP